MGEGTQGWPPASFNASCGGMKSVVDKQAGGSGRVETQGHTGVGWATSALSKADSPFPTALWLSQMLAPPIFKASHLGGAYLSSTGSVPDVELNPLLLREELCVCEIIPSCGWPHQEWGSWQDCFCTPPTCLSMALFMYLFSSFIVEGLFFSLWVFCRESCSICSCNFGVSLGGGGWAPDLPIPPSWSLSPHPFLSFK